MAIKNIAAILKNRSAVSITLSVLVSFLFVFAFATSTTTISSTGITTTGSFNVAATTTINGVTYYWPSADGSPNQVLTTDGSGNLTWTTATGGGFNGGPLNAQYFNATDTAATSTFYGVRINSANGRYASLSRSNSNNLFTLSNMANTTALGGVGFFAEGDYVSVPNLDRNTLSVSAWIKRDRSGTINGETVIGGNYGSWGIYFTPTNTIGFGHVGYSGVESVGTVSDTNWHFITVTYDGVDVNYYIDGGLDSTIPYADNFDSSGAVYGIGFMPNVGNPLVGTIDELVVWSSILSAGDVTTMYNGGAGQEESAGNPNIVAGWHFNDSYRVVADFKNGAHNGTFFGGASYTAGKLGNVGSYFSDSSVLTVEDGTPGLTSNKIKLGNDFSETQILGDSLNFFSKGSTVPSFIVDSQGAVGIGGVPTSILGVTFYANGGGTIDDLATGGTFTGSASSKDYVVVISTAGTPDKFQFSDNNGASWSPETDITGTEQSLSDGVTITFGATTGHMVPDQWNFTAQKYNLKLTGGLIRFDNSSSANYYSRIRPENSALNIGLFKKSTDSQVAQYYLGDSGSNGGEIYMEAKTASSTNWIDIADNGNSGFFQFNSANPQSGGYGEAIGYSLRSEFYNLDTPNDSYTAFRLNVADTVDPDVVKKYLMDLQTDNVSKFALDSAGQLALGVGGNAEVSDVINFADPGSGIDDIIVAGDMYVAADTLYTITIDGTGPDTFSWSDGTDSAAGVPITPGTPVLLSNGVTIDFTGAAHVGGEVWTFSVKQMGLKIQGNGDLVFRNNDGSRLGVKNRGNGQWYLNGITVNGLRRSELDFQSDSMGLYGYDTTSGTSTVYAAGIQVGAADGAGYRKISFETRANPNGFGLAESFLFEPNYSLMDTAGDGYTAIKLNVTDALGGATGNRYLMDLQVADVSKFKINSAGSVTVTSNENASTFSIIGDNADTNTDNPYISILQQGLAASYAGDAVRIMLNNDDSFPSSGNFFAGYSRGILAEPKVLLKADGGAYFSGNVGIGTTTPSTKLHVRLSDGPLEAVTDPNAIAVFDNPGGNAPNVHINVGSGQDVANYYFTLNGTSYEAGTRYNVTGDYLALMIDGDAIGEEPFVLKARNVGIGTTSPLALLTVGSSTPSYLTAGQYYNSAYVSGQLEVGGSGTSTFAGYIDVKGDATATSTFTGNLRVLGTLQSGDLVFANSFRFYEDPMPIDGILQNGTQHLKLTNQKGEDILSIDENGNLKTPTFYSTSTVPSEGSLLADVFSLIGAQLQNIKLTVWEGVVAAKEFIAEKIIGKQVCVEDVCFDKSEADILKTVVNERKSGQSSVATTPASTSSDPTPTPQITTDSTTTPPVDSSLVGTTTPVDVAPAPADPPASTTPAQ